MDNKKNILTYAGLKKLEDELEQLKVVKRKRFPRRSRRLVSRVIYLRMLSMMQLRMSSAISRLVLRKSRKSLKNAEVVVEEEVDLDKISIGCKIRILDCEFDEELEYKIVGSTEANSLKGKISNESPVGKALLGKKVGDTVTVETQVGELTYKVLEIQRAEEN